MPGPFKICGDTAVFGIRIVVESDDAAALNKVLAIFETTDCADAANPSVYVVLKSIGADRGIADHNTVVGDQLRIVRNGIEIRADGAQGKGCCSYPRSAAPDDMLGEMMGTLVLFLVAQAGRIPIHASGVMLGGAATVLAGRSGMGKSSLALAADRRGLPVLSDDTVYVQLTPSFRLWAMPKAIHLFEKDAPPGLAGAMRFRSGRWKRALPIAAPHGTAERAMLCVLARGNRVVLERMDEEAAIAEITSRPEDGYGLYGERAAAAVRAIAAGGCWRLTLSRDPDAAISALVGAFGHPKSLAAGC